MITKEEAIKAFQTLKDFCEQLKIQYQDDEMAPCYYCPFECWTEHSDYCMLNMR